MKQLPVRILVLGYAFNASESQSEHKSIRGAMMSDDANSGMGGGGMGHGYGWNESGANGTMVGGYTHMDAMGVIMDLLTSADSQLIDRTVQPLFEPNTTDQVGVETYTTSADPSVARNIQLHVLQMQELLKQAQAGQGGNIRQWDPLFAALHGAAGEIELEVALLENGVHAWHGGSTRCAAALVQAHADAVSKFASNGHDEVMVSHPVPEICNSSAGQQQNGFVNFEEYGVNSSDWVNASSWNEENHGNGMWGTNNGGGMMNGNDDHMGWHCNNGTNCSNGSYGDQWNCTGPCMNGTMGYGENCHQDMPCGNRTYGWNCSDGTPCGSQHCSFRSFCGTGLNSSSTNGDLLQQHQSSANMDPSSSTLLLFVAAVLFSVIWA